MTDIPLEGSQGFSSARNRFTFHDVSSSPHSPPDPTCLQGKRLSLKRVLFGAPLLLQAAAQQDICIAGIQPHALTRLPVPQAKALCTIELASDCNEDTSAVTTCAGISLGISCCSRENICRNSVEPQSHFWNGLCHQASVSRRSLPLRANVSAMLLP